VNKKKKKKLKTKQKENGQLPQNYKDRQKKNFKK